MDIQREKATASEETVAFAAYDSITDYRLPFTVYQMIYSQAMTAWRMDCQTMFPPMREVTAETAARTKMMIPRSRR